MAALVQIQCQPPFRTFSPPFTLFFTTIMNHLKILQHYSMLKHIYIEAAIPLPDSYDIQNNH